MLLEWTNNYKLNISKPIKIIIFLNIIVFIILLIVSIELKENLWYHIFYTFILSSWVYLSLYWLSNKYDDYYLKSAAKKYLVSIKYQNKLDAISGNKNKKKIIKKHIWFNSKGLIFSLIMIILLLIGIMMFFCNIYYIPCYVITIFVNFHLLFFLKLSQIIRLKK